MKDPARLGISVAAGSAQPFGAAVFADGINFALYSRHAEAVSLVLYASGDEEPICEIPFDPRLHRTGDVWHLRLAGLRAGFRYGYRLDGPWDPAHGHYFRRDQVLVDPYATALSGGAVWGSPLVRRGGRMHPFRYLRRCFLPENGFDWEGDRPLGRPLEDTVIYEMHLRGFTIDPSAGVRHPGTFLGLIEKIPYLQELGVTAVELLPINEFDELSVTNFNPVSGERLRQYWGYNPLAFFAPNAAFAAGGIEGRQVEEFKRMVKALHRAGIEVILDVVFNHTGEGNQDGPAFSFRGIENATYYMVNADGYFMDYSGCGNTFNCNHPVVRRFILDCLRYWVAEMHVDGFRFDLASVLGRDQQGNVLANPPVLEEIANDPILADTKIIAEAWDAAGLYQVGSFPSWGRWAEWNGRYRDDLRRFLRGDGGMAGAFATRLAGSADLYHASGRRPGHSINFITSHDGFTLRDLFSYNEKHNFENGEYGRDGDNNNHSDNQGAEGETDDAHVNRRRRRLVRSAFLGLCLSQGTPMLTAGDECGRTQRGNNNAYCQDNAVSWVDWRLVEENADLLRFVRLALAFRRAHPVLRRRDFFRGEPDPQSGATDIEWHGLAPGAPDFTTRCIAVVLSGDQPGAGIADDTLYLAANMDSTVRRFRLPAPPHGKVWHLVADSGATPPGDFREPGNELPLSRGVLLLRPRAIALVIAQ